MAYDEELAQRIRTALKGTKTEEKKMFGGIAFMVNGRMAVGVTKERMMVRTGAEAHAESLKKPHVKPMDFTGRPMKGMIFVDPPGCATAAQVAPWAKLATKVALAEPSKSNRKRKK
jgi:hypothetical protein